MLTRQNTVGCFENASNSDKESALNTTKNKNVCAKHNDHSGASDRNYAPAPRVGGIKQWCASDVCLPVAYIGPKSTTRPRKTKIGTEVAHVIRDSDTTFKVKRSTCRGRGHIVAASRTACCIRIDALNHKQHVKQLYLQLQNVHKSRTQTHSLSYAEQITNNTSYQYTA